VVNFCVREVVNFSLREHSVDDARPKVSVEDLLESWLLRFNRRNAAVSFTMSFEPES